MNKNIKSFFYQFWWLYYLLCFFLLGGIIYLLFQSINYTNSQNSLTDIRNKIENCNCRYTEIRPIENDQNLSDSLRVIDNQGEFGCLSFTLIWNTYDDLDLHLIDVNEEHIFFERFCKGNDNQFTNAGGQLDIDLNAGGNKTENPVENVYFKCYPPNGAYRVYVNAYHKENDLPLSFNLIVRENGTVVKQIEGTINRNKENKFLMDYIYRNNENR